MADIHDADVARELVQIGGQLADMAAALGPAVRMAGAHIIADLLTPEHAVPLAERCEEAGRQLRHWAIRHDEVEPPAIDHDFAAAARGAYSTTKGTPCPPPPSPTAPPSGSLNPSAPSPTLSPEPSKWKSAPSATAADSTSTTTRARGVGDLDRYPNAADCDRCDNTGVLRWQQPMPDGNGGTVLRDMEHACPCGRGPSWKHPAAEADRVIGAPGAAPARVRGHADAANKAGMNGLLGDLLAEHPALKGERQHGREA
ncbi:hypothetical protein [Alloactinosynnema sp. L-07]|uniref:hypothetical protein n=1 Tax=Alloactinosynnema sp. L-07 TaxID=1653480 RepID=UPI00065EF4A9|nr:hypothetical protein [Alloactinosynnema sp. L-07]CRK59101.1 hypothetical protein [Alloactinosynnema sp. L-07]